MAQTIGILAPAGRDSAVVAAILRKASIECLECADGQELIDALEKRRAGAIVVTEEAFRRSELETLIEWVKAQPPWSAQRERHPPVQPGSFARQYDDPRTPVLSGHTRVSSEIGAAGARTPA
jgi:hypothetical protein